MQEDGAETSSLPTASGDGPPGHALQEDDRRFRALIENSSDAIVVLDREGNVSYESPSFLRLAGLEPSAAIGHNFFEGVHPDDMLKVGEAFDLLLATPGGTLRAEVCVQHIDGSWRWVEAIGTNLLDDPSVHGIVINMRDISDRKRAEERITFLSAMVENSPVSVIATDASRRIIYVNQATEQLYGYQKEELLGKDPAVLSSDCNSTPSIEEQIWDTVSRGEIWTGEVLNRKKSGEPFHVQASARALLDENGEFIALIRFQQDVTDRKRAEEALRDSESRYRLLAENVTDVIYFIDMEARPIHVSPSVERLLGYSLEEAMSRSMEQTLTPASLEVAREALAKAVRLRGTEQEGPYGKKTLELEMRRKDGSTVWTENTMSFVLGQDGKPVGILGVSRDISERKRVEYELERHRERLEEEVQKRTAELVTSNEQLLHEIAERERAEDELVRSEARYRMLAEHVSDVIWSMTPDLKYTYISPAVTRLRGYTVEEAMGQTIQEVLTPESLQTAMEMRAEEVARLKARGSGELAPRTLEVEMTCKDGSTVWTETVISYLTDPIRGVVGVLGVSRDISERKRAEERIKRLNVVLRAMRAVNQLITKEKDIDRLLQGACAHLVETRGYASAWIALLDDSGGCVTAAEAGLGQDFRPLIERLKAGQLVDCARKALAQSGIVTTEDPSSSCVDCPLLASQPRRTAMTVRLEHGAKVYGLLSVSIPAELPADDEERSLFTELATDISFALYSIEGEEKRRQADENIREANAQLRQALQQVEASQAQLLQSGKLAAIGELISGVTHELNNPLAAISMYSELLIEEVADEGIQRTLRKLKAQADRAGAIVRNLLSFARKHEPRKSYISINECVARTVELRAYELNLDNIQVVLRLDDSLPNTMADFNQLQQVFLNIITNAHQVMTEARGRGTLVIQTRRAGDMIQVRFTDDGPGIPADKLDRIFEPFFTTKDVGKGTGLGLSICYGIVQGHGGRIYAESEEGMGARFVVELPIIVSGNEHNAEGTAQTR